MKPWEIWVIWSRSVLMMLFNLLGIWHRPERDSAPSYWPRHEPRLVSIDKSSFILRLLDMNRSLAKNWLTPQISAQLIFYDEIFQKCVPAHNFTRRVRWFTFCRRVGTLMTFVEQDVATCTSTQNTRPCGNGCRVRANHATYLYRWNWGEKEKIVLLLMSRWFMCGIAQINLCMSYKISQRSNFGSSHNRNICQSSLNVVKLLYILYSMPLLNFWELKKLEYSQFPP